MFYIGFYAHPLVAVLAALFAAIPIMAPYVVCAIGIFELYLVRGETAAAILFFILSVAPVTFADAAFYRQLRFVGFISHLNIKTFNIRLAFLLS